MKLKYLLLIPLVPILIGCSKPYQKTLIISKYSIQQFKNKQQKGLIIFSNTPHKRTLTYYYTNKNPQILDSLKVEYQIYTRKTDLGNIVLDFEQQNLRSYLKELETKNSTKL